MNTEGENLHSRSGPQPADEQLVHALLLHLHDEAAAEHREQRVQAAMQAIRQSTAAPTAAAPTPAAVPARRPLQLPAWAWRSAGAVAALILLAVGFWMLAGNATPALASLNDIIGALGRPGDRTYHIQMEDLPEPPRRGPDDSPPEMLPRPGLDDAKLYLRDGRQYLLVRNDPSGGLIYDGYDGQQSWRVRKGSLAETKEGLGAGGIPMPPIMADVPFCDLHQTLERIRQDYTVEQFDQAALASGQELLRHVKVRRNSHEIKGPETIEIWADSRTGMPKRIIFDDAKIQGSRQPCRLTFDRTDEDSQPVDWFQPGPHVPANSR